MPHFVEQLQYLITIQLILSKEIATKYDNVFWETEMYKDGTWNEFELKYLKSNCWKAKQRCRLGGGK